MKRLSQYFLFAGSILLAITLITACTASPTATPEPTAAFQVILPSPPPTSAARSPAEMEVAAESVVTTTVAVETFKWYGINPNIGTLIEGAESTLVRMPHGVSMTFKTVGLTPGDAVTMWWIIFNRPENCSKIGRAS